MHPLIKKFPWLESDAINATRNWQLTGHSDKGWNSSITYSQRKDPRLSWADVREVYEAVRANIAVDAPRIDSKAITAPTLYPAQALPPVEAPQGEIERIPTFSIPSPPATGTCPQCGNPVGRREGKRPRTYCSSRCSRKWRKDHLTAIGICYNCERAPVKEGRKMCVECSDRYKRKSAANYSRKIKEVKDGQSTPLPTHVEEDTDEALHPGGWERDSTPEGEECDYYLTPTYIERERRRNLAAIGIMSNGTRFDHGYPPFDPDATGSCFFPSSFVRQGEGMWTGYLDAADEDEDGNPPPPLPEEVVRPTMPLTPCELMGMRVDWCKESNRWRCEPND